MKFKEIKQLKENEIQKKNPKEETRLNERDNVVPTNIVMNEYFKLKKKYKNVLDYLRDK